MHNYKILLNFSFLFSDSVLELEFNPFHQNQKKKKIYVPTSIAIFFFNLICLSSKNNSGKLCILGEVVG